MDNLSGRPLGGKGRTHIKVIVAGSLSCLGVNGAFLAKVGNRLILRFRSVLEQLLGANLPAMEAKLFKSSPWGFEGPDETLGPAISAKVAAVRAAMELMETGRADAVATRADVRSSFHSTKGLAAMSREKSPAGTLFVVSVAAPTSRCLAVPWRADNKGRCV